MARVVVLNIETTGLDVNNGNHVVEIAAVELIDRCFSGKKFHRYLNPERTIEPGAEAIHGLTLEFLRDKPTFRNVATEFIEFVRGAILVAHNASFDIGFIDKELSLFNHESVDVLCSTVIDTLSIAIEQRPQQKNNLNALCEAYQINVPSDLHGALLDAHVLAQVYLALTSRQPL